MKTARVVRGGIVNNLQTETLMYYSAWLINPATLFIFITEIYIYILKLEGFDPK